MDDWVYPVIIVGAALVGFCVLVIIVLAMREVAAAWRAWRKRTHHLPPRRPPLDWGE